MLKTFYKKGTYNAICDVCGFKFKADQMRERWDGNFVCKKDYESRHPMDFFNPNLEEHHPEITRPREVAGSETFINVNYIPNPPPIPSNPVPPPATAPICSIEDRSSKAGVGVAGCIVAGFCPVLS